MSFMRATTRRRLTALRSYLLLQERRAVKMGNNARGLRSHVHLIDDILKTHGGPVDEA